MHEYDINKAFSCTIFEMKRNNIIILNDKIKLKRNNRN